MPSNSYVTLATYGQFNATTGFYNAYATLGRSFNEQPSPPGLLHSTDSGRTWAFYPTTDTIYNNPTYIDTLELHPTVPGLFLGHQLVNASSNVFAPYLGKIGGVTANGALPISPVGLNGAKSANATWAGWSKTANTSLFLMAQATAGVAPTTGESLIRAQLSSASTMLLGYVASVVVPEVSDVTQVGNFVLAEVPTSHPATGFNQTALQVRASYPLTCTLHFLLSFAMRCWPLILQVVSAGTRQEHFCV